MKKILYVLLISVMLLPLVVKADRDLDGQIVLYSENVSVGSTLVYKYRAVCGNECDEILTYNPDELDYVSISAEFPSWENNNLGEPQVKIIDNDPGTLKYDYTLNLKENNINYLETEITVKFIVKSIPANGTIELVRKSLDSDFNPIEGLTSILKITSANSEEDSDVTQCNCPKCDYVENTDNTDKVEDKTIETTDNKSVETVGEEKECPKCEEKKCDNLWFIVAVASLIVNAILLVVIIFVSLKKKNKDDENKAQPVSVDKSI